MNRLLVIPIVLGVISAVARAETVDDFVKSSLKDGFVRVKVLAEVEQVCGAESRVTVEHTVDGPIDLRPGEVRYFLENHPMVPLLWQEGNRHRSTPHPPRDYPLMGHVKAVRSKDGRRISWYALEVKIGALSEPMTVKRIVNSANRSRYVTFPRIAPLKQTTKEPATRSIKLFLDRRALLKQDPLFGFDNGGYRDFKNSCGPQAALNVLRWYGAEELEDVTRRTLYEDMKTNRWVPKLKGPLRAISGTLDALGLRLPGTSTPNFSHTLRHYLAGHIPKKTEYRTDSGGLYGGRTMYRLVEHCLINGHPISVNYKVDEFVAHWAVIVGLEAMPDVRRVNGENVYSFHDPANDLVILANGPTMKWSDFHSRWKKNLFPMSKYLLPLAREYEYTRVIVAKKMRHGEVNLAIVTNTFGASHLLQETPNRMATVEDHTKRPQRRRSIGGIEVIEERPF